MDISTEFDQCVCYLVACDPFTTRPRNKTLTAVVHVLFDVLLSNPSLVRPRAPVTVDYIVSYCLFYADTIKEVYAQNSSLLCKFSIFGDNDTRRCVLQIHLLSKLVGNVLPPLSSACWNRSSSTSLSSYDENAFRKTFLTLLCRIKGVLTIMLEVKEVHA